MVQVRQLADQYKWPVRIAGLAMVAVGLYLVFTSGLFAGTFSSVPGMQGDSVFMQGEVPDRSDEVSAPLNVEQVGGLPLFQTVGTGAETVQLEATVENTGDVREEFRLAVKGSNIVQGNQGTIRVSVEGGSSDTASPGDTTRRMTTDFVNLAPGESETFTVDVELSDTADGDVFKIAMYAEVPSGSRVSDIINKDITVQEGSASVTAAFVGGSFAALGLAALGLTA